MDGFAEKLPDDGSGIGSEEIYLLISFDIVGSTDFKNYEQNWPNTFQQFYSDAFAEFVQEQPSGCSHNFWKTLGDEVLFQADIVLPDDALTSVSHIHKVCKSLSNKLKTKRLDVKATAWIAGFKPDVMHNIIVPKGIFLEKDEIDPEEDYIGLSIDEGFRVAQYLTRPRRVTVSFDLARLLAESTKGLERLYNVGYLELKGIWNGLPYPAIWYSEDQSIEKKDLPYDLELTCEFSRKFGHKDTTHIDRTFFNRVLERMPTEPKAHSEFVIRSCKEAAKIPRGKKQANKRGKVQK